MKEDPNKPVSEPCKECHRTDGMHNLSCKTGAQKDWDSSEGQTHSFGDGCIPAHEEKVWNCNAAGLHEIGCPHMKALMESLTPPFHYEGKPTEKDMLFSCLSTDCPERTGGKCKTAPEEKSAPSKCPNCGRSSEVVDMASCPYCTPEKSNDCKCQRCDPFKENSAEECQRAGCYHERAKHVDDYLSCSIVGCRCGAFFIFSSKPPTPSKAEDWENELYELIENGKPFKTFLFVQDLLETHGAKEYERGKNENLKGSRNRLLYESAREEGYKVGKEEKHQLTITIETNAREAQLREDIAAIERSFYDAATLHQERVSSGDTWEISKRDFNAIISLLKSKLPQD